MKEFKTILGFITLELTKRTMSDTMVYCYFLAGLAEGRSRFVHKEVQRLSKGGWALYQYLNNGALSES